MYRAPPPILGKLALCHFTFMKDPHQCLFSLTESNLKKTATFMKKAKSEDCFRRLFLVAIIGTARIPGAGVALTAPSPEPHSALVARAVSCVCEHLGFISIYFVRLSARCVLR